MKTKKYSWKAAALAVGMACCTITAFTVSAQGTPKEVTVKTSSAQSAKDETAKSKKQLQQKPQRQIKQLLWIYNLLNRDRL